MKRYYLSLLQGHFNDKLDWKNILWACPMKSLLPANIKADLFRLFVSHCSIWMRVLDSRHECEIKSEARGGLKGLKTPLSDQNIDVYFLSFSPTLYCKLRSGALQNVLRQYHRRSNTFFIKPSGYEFSRFEKYWSSFLHSCVFCTTIYNKSWVLSCSASVEASMTLNYQQCRLMCSLYVTKLGPS